MDPEQDLDDWIEGFCREEETNRREMGRLNIGERVILTVPDPAQDGRRGTVQDAHPGDVYDVKFDDSVLVVGWIGGNRLERETDCPDYPLPTSEVKR